MHHPYTLDLLSIGKKAKISSLSSKGIQRRRMLDLGLVQGAEIQAIFESPSKNPVAYFVKGTVIALRNEDAKNILIKQ